VKQDSDGESTIVVPINGSFQIGEWYISLQVGTPAQTFDFQADTGSADLLVYSTGCTTCGHAPFFMPNMSSTIDYVSCNGSNTPKGWQCRACFEVNTTNVCGFLNIYGSGTGGTVSGPIVFDMVQVNGTSIMANASFGLIENSTNGFQPTGVSGIMGLDFQPDSSWNETVLFQHWVQSGGIQNNFSMCIATDGGSISFGINTSVNYNWIPLTQEIVLCADGRFRCQ